MKRHPKLSGSWDKLWWAHQHSKMVKAEIDRLLNPERNPRLIEVKHEPDTDSFVWIVEELPSLRLVALMLGDAIHNMRASLDHLAWALVKLGADPYPRRPNQVQFPLAQSAASFTDQLDRRLPGVPAIQRAIVQRYQPYKRDARSTSMRILRDLSDRDKHRLLIPSVMTPEEFEGRFDVTGARPTKIESLFSRRALEQGTPIIRLYIEPWPPDNPHAEVKMKGKLTLHPTFGYGRRILRNLDTMGRTISETLEAIENIL